MIILEEEIWKSIVYDGKPTKLEISNYGNVRKIEKDRGTFITVQKKKSPAKIWIKRNLSIRRDYLVASAFLPPPKHDNKTVFHKDGKPSNCHVNNLTWMITP